LPAWLRDLEIVAAGCAPSNGSSRRTRLCRFLRSSFHDWRVAIKVSSAATAGKMAETIAVQLLTAAIQAIARFFEPSSELHVEDTWYRSTPDYEERIRIDRCISWRAGYPKAIPDNRRRGKAIGLSMTTEELTA
jgi:hypothetical protein